MLIEAEFHDISNDPISLLCPNLPDICLFMFKTKILIFGFSVLTHRMGELPKIAEKPGGITFLNWCMTMFNKETCSP